MVHARIAAKTAVAFSSPGTALTTLVFVPLCEVLLVLAITTGLTGQFAMITAYAAAIVGLGASVITGVVGEITRDRNIGVLAEVMRAGLWQPKYWVAKVLVPLTSGVVVALASLIALVVADPAHDLVLFGRALVVAVAACVSGALVGIAAAMLTLGGNDPYLVANLLGGVLMLGTGVVLPIDAGPPIVGALGRALPFTALIDGLRHGELLRGIGVEALVVLVWCGVALALSGVVMRRFRSGRVLELLW